MENLNPELKDNASKFLRSNLNLLINSYVTLLISLMMNIPKAEQND